MNKAPGLKQFTQDTVVAEVIQKDPDALERLIALHPKFKRLRNPVLRRTMAKLATLADAARIAGLPVRKVVSAANGSAELEPEGDRGLDNSGPVAAEVRPDWFRLIDDAGAARLDVRPLLDAGKDPLAEIMAVALSVDEGSSLIIDAPFDPAPLRRVLARKGFVSYASAESPDHCRVYFLRDSAREAAVVDPFAAKASAAQVWSERGETHIDVCGLEPPQPMLSILKLLDTVEPGTAVVVHHEREPIFLYPELAERGWDWQRLEAVPHEVRLRLERAAP